MASNPNKSSLLDLPSEVRVRLYSMLFGYGPQVIESSMSGMVWGARPEQRSAQLLAVSRVVFHEAITIFYDQTTTSVGRHDEFVEWYSTTTEGSNTTLRYVRRLVLDLHPDWLEPHRKDEIFDMCQINVPNIQDITLISYAFCWSINHPAARLRDADLTFDETTDGMRLIGATMLVQHNLTHLVEESIRGKKVVIRIWRAAGEALDRSVSLSNISY